MRRASRTAGRSTPLQVEPRIREYWGWIAWALYLLVTLDLLTTFYAAAVVGPQAESNPVMAWLIVQPLSVVVAINVGVVVLAAVFFRCLMGTLRRTPAPYDRYFAVVIEVWLGGLLAAGLFVFANNVAVIVHGASLL